MLLWNASRWFSQKQATDCSEDWLSKSALSGPQLESGLKKTASVSKISQNATEIVGEYWPIVGDRELCVNSENSRLTQFGAMIIWFFTTTLVLIFPIVELVHRTFFWNPPIWFIWRFSRYCLCYPRMRYKDLLRLETAVSHAPRRHNTYRMSGLLGLLAYPVGVYHITLITAFAGALGMSLFWISWRRPCYATKVLCNLFVSIMNDWLT